MRVDADHGRPPAARCMHAPRRGHVELSRCARADARRAPQLTRGGRADVKPLIDFLIQIAASGLIGLAIDELVSRWQDRCERRWVFGLRRFCGQLAAASLRTRRSVKLKPAAGRTLRSFGDPAARVLLRVQPCACSYLAVGYALRRASIATGCLLADKPMIFMGSGKILIGNARQRLEFAAFRRINAAYAH